MNCDFINSLTPEQKAELRKALEEPTSSIPKYEVRTEYWANGKIRLLEEYLNGQLHGKDLEWYENGQKKWETDWFNGQRHGKDLGWHKNGQKYWEADYLNGQRHGKYLGWHEDGRKRRESDYEYSELVKEHVV